MAGWAEGDAERINTNGDLEVVTHAPSNFISRPFLIGESRVQAMPRALWPACRDRAAGMTSARLALSSHSLHERDDRAERILRIHVGMWLRAMPVEQLPAARHLAGERGALAEVPALGRHVRTGASGGADHRCHFDHRKIIPTHDLQTA